MTIELSVDGNQSAQAPRRLIPANIDVIPVLRPDPGKIKADPAQIQQILINLVVNARDAMPQGGK